MMGINLRKFPVVKQVYDYIKRQRRIIAEIVTEFIHTSYSALFKPSDISATNYELPGVSISSRNAFSEGAVA